MGILGPGPAPKEIAGLMIRAYENPLVSLNKAGLLTPPLFLGGGSFGGAARIHLMDTFFCQHPK